jgi:CRISPR/Cas system-associated protein Cas10 (large subunit of type III CRISPR-Cas system)
MLNKGLRDEKKVKIDTMLSTLLSLVFVPKFWIIEDISLVDNLLTNFELTVDILKQIEEKDLILLLDKHEMDWAQKEQFADFLLAFSKENPFDLSIKSIAIYEHIQSVSKTFSFEIFSKIASAKANL